MRSFKEYMSEVFLMKDFKKGDASRWFKSILNKKIDTKEYSLLSKMSNGYTMYGFTNIPSGVLVREFLIVDSTDKVTAVIEMRVINKSINSYSVEKVKSISANKMPLYKAYAHLITKHNFIIVSDLFQSLGGALIWQKLSKEPGVSVHGWDTKAKINKAINLGDKLINPDDNDEIYVTSIDHSSKEYVKIKNVVLVAHKKTKTK